MTTFRTLATVRHHGMDLTDYEFTVPLDHAKPEGETLSIFARAVTNSEKPGATRPWLVFLQGGPGFPGPRPLTKSGWVKRALDDYHVLLLDSRGNGRSSVVLPQTLARRGNARAQADYLMHFRADSIVRDAELIRRQLLGADEPWSVLGQSYGGFCAVHYLSAFPQGLREAFITGGLPPLSGSADDYYRHTYSEVQRKTRKFFARYPADQELCTRILTHLHRHEIALPGGRRLTVRFQQVGFMLGFDEGMRIFTTCWRRILRASPATNSACRSCALEHSQPFEIVHLRRPTRCVRPAGRRRWSASACGASSPEMDWARAGSVVHRRDDLSVDVRDYPGLRRCAMWPGYCARERWPALYDPATRPQHRACVATIYAEDMYVPPRATEATAAAAWRRVRLTSE
jgi:pimeloyl-ACP methyl ester carboxylesterase